MNTNDDDELKKYLANYFKNGLGKDIDPDNIILFDLEDVESDVEYLTTEQLAYIYGYSIMTENYEKADKIKKELELRQWKVDFNMDKCDKGLIDVIITPYTKIENLIIKFTVSNKAVSFDDE